MTIADHCTLLLSLKQPRKDTLISISAFVAARDSHAERLVFQGERAYELAILAVLIAGFHIQRLERSPAELTRRNDVSPRGALNRTESVRVSRK